MQCRLNHSKIARFPVVRRGRLPHKTAFTDGPPLFYVFSFHQARAKPPPLILFRSGRGRFRLDAFYDVDDFIQLG